MKTIIACLLVICATEVCYGQAERHRIVGKVVDTETVDVNGIEVKIKFRGRKAELEEAVGGVPKCLYGSLIYNKKAKTFSFNVREIEFAKTKARIEIYNGVYPIMDIKEDYCLLATKYGRFKFFYHNMEEDAVANIRSGKSTKMICLIFYYDDEAQEICVKYPPLDEMKSRIIIDVSPEARSRGSLVYLDD